ncbi:hypothetical protein D6D29_10720 [Aureobasidium pullulans]|nr:hypothetical protein D6D29_10720 [Aureobasidium pullulans]
MPAQSSTSATEDPPKIKEEWRRHAWKQKTFAQLLASEGTIIKLESKEKRSPASFAVHKALLCFFSPYHDKLLNGNFMEGKNLPDRPLVVNAGANVLKLFATWLYTGTIHLSAPGTAGHDHREWYTGMTKLYILGDALNCVALLRSVISAQPKAKSSNNLFMPPTSVIEWISGSSLESSQLYRYYTDFWTAHWDGEIEIDGKWQIDVDGKDRLPENFAYRILMRRLEEEANRFDIRKCVCCEDPCRYHGHENETERKANQMERKNQGKDDAGLEVERIKAA